MKYDVCIVLLNYNNARDTLECIESIKRNEKKSKYKIIVVDNNSVDNSDELLMKREDIIYIKNKDNSGFAIGNNIGIEHAINNYETDFVLILNNDTVIGENAITNMISLARKHDNMGIVTCKIMKYYSPNEIDMIGGLLDWNKLKASFNYTYFDNDTQYSKISSGACMLIPVSVIEKVGMLPTDYFMYYEDIDYSCKIIDNGYKIGVCEDAKIYHKFGGTAGAFSPFSIKWNTRNRIVFYKKNKEKVNSFYFVSYFILTRIAYEFWYLVSFKWKELISMNKGIIEGLKWRK